MWLLFTLDLVRDLWYEVVALGQMGLQHQAAAFTGSGLLYFPDLRTPRFSGDSLAQTILFSHSWMASWMSARTSG